MNGKRASILGMVFTLTICPISYQAKKQTIVMQSTVKSEYMTLVHAIKEFIWLYCLLKDLGIIKYEPIVLYCNNLGAISLAKNSSHHAKTKYIDVQLHFIQDYIKKGTVKIEYYSMENILANIIMKGLAHERHGKLLGFMGMRM
jgi:hypothetical protein